MVSKEKRKIARIISWVVIVSAMCVIVGWILDIRVLKSIHPSWISMQFDTAVAFVLSGTILCFIVRALEGEFDKAQVVLPVTSLVIILLMGILLFSSVLKIHTGLEDLFVKDSKDAVKSMVPGRPSIPIMFNFILIGIAGILFLLNPDKCRPVLTTIGIIVAGTGMLAIIGYCIDLPILFYYIEGINTEIACHTAVLFVLLGIGLLCL